MLRILFLCLIFTSPLFAAFSYEKYRLFESLCALLNSSDIVAYYKVFFENHKVVTYHTIFDLCPFYMQPGFPMMLWAPFLQYEVLAQLQGDLNCPPKLQAFFARRHIYFQHRLDQYSSVCTWFLLPPVMNVINDNSKNSPARKLIHLVCLAWHVTDMDQTWMMPTVENVSPELEIAEILDTCYSRYLKYWPVRDVKAYSFRVYLLDLICRAFPFVFSCLSLYTSVVMDLMRGFEFKAKTYESLKECLLSANPNPLHSSSVLSKDLEGLADLRLLLLSLTSDLLIQLQSFLLSMRSKFAVPVLPLTHLKNVLGEMLSSTLPSFLSPMSFFLNMHFF